MYRGFPANPVPQCAHCNGTGRIKRTNPNFTYDCPSCNGTGIAGNLRHLGILLIIWMVICAAFAAWLLFG